jgi:ribosomal protein L37E
VLVRCVASRAFVSVGEMLATSERGIVYAAQVEANASDPDVVCRWYYPQFATSAMRHRLGALVRCGDLGPRFTWPLDLVESDALEGFGSVSRPWPIRALAVADILHGGVDLGFRDVATAGIDIVDAFADLHRHGFCFHDITPADVRIEIGTTRALIGTTEGIGLSGPCDPTAPPSPTHTAPELARGADASAATDLHAVAVLLYLLFMLDHPLEGRRVLDHQRWDADAMRAIYVDDPRFVFDPDDESNRPEPGVHDNARSLWPVYPQFLRDLFVQAFTEGLRDPAGGRVPLSVWRAALARTRDLLVACVRCGRQNYADTGAPPRCWSCGAPLGARLRMSVGHHDLVLDNGTLVYPHHVLRNDDYTMPIATVEPHPNDPELLGLRNLDADPWVAHLGDGTQHTVRPGRAVRLEPGMWIEMHGRVASVTLENR